MTITLVAYRQCSFSHLRIEVSSNLSGQPLSILHQSTSVKGDAVAKFGQFSVRHNICGANTFCRMCGLLTKEFRCSCAFCQRTLQLARDCQFRLLERTLQKRQYNFIIRWNVSKPQTYKHFNCCMLLQWKEDGISWPCLLYK